MPDHVGCFPFGFPKVIVTYDNVIQQSGRVAATRWRHRTHVERTIFHRQSRGGGSNTTAHYRFTCAATVATLCVQPSDSQHTYFLILVNRHFQVRFYFSQTLPMLLLIKMPTYEVDIRREGIANLI